MPRVVAECCRGSWYAIDEFGLRWQNEVATPLSERAPATECCKSSESAGAAPLCRRSPKRFHRLRDILKQSCQKISPDYLIAGTCQPPACRAEVLTKADGVFVNYSKNH
jgi:hypothetical protein